MRGDVGHAELDHGRRRDHGTDDVGRGDRHREPDDPDDQRGIDRGQQQIAAGIVDHDRREFQPQSGQRHHADDDAGGRAGGGGGQRLQRTIRQCAHQLLRGQRGLARDVAHQRGHADGVEHRGGRRIAPHHEDDDGDQRDEVEAVAARQFPQRIFGNVGLAAHAVALAVEFHHEEQRQVVKDGRDGRHPDHVEIADLEEFGDQERRGTENRRRDDGAEPACRQQTAGGILLEAGLLHHRIGNGADRDRGRHARPRRPAEQKRRQHDRASGGVGRPSHQRHREVDEELAGAGLLQERAEDREQHDQGCGYVDRDAEDAFQRDEQMSDQRVQPVAAVIPGWRKPGPGPRIGDEQKRDDRYDRTDGAARRLDQQDDEGDTEDHVGVVGSGRAVGEILAANDRVDQDADTGQAGDHVPPADAVAKARGGREHQKRQQQHEGDVGVAQFLGRNDLVGGIEVEQRHRDRDHGHDDSGPAQQAIGGALFLLDEFLGLAQAFGLAAILREIRLRFLRHPSPVAFSFRSVTRPVRV